MPTERLLLSIADHRYSMPITGADGRLITHTQAQPHRNNEFWAVVTRAQWDEVRRTRMMENPLSLEFIIPDVEYQTADGVIHRTLEAAVQHESKDSKNHGATAALNYVVSQAELREPSRLAEICGMALAGEDPAPLLEQECLAEAAFDTALAHLITAAGKPMLAAEIVTSMGIPGEKDDAVQAIKKAVKRNPAVLEWAGPRLRLKIKEIP